MIDKKDYKNEKIAKWKAFGVVWALGIQFATTVVVCIVIGYYLDRYFHTMPVMLFLFTIAGFVAGMLTFYRAIKGVNRGNGNKR